MPVTPPHSPLLLPAVQYYQQASVSQHNQQASVSQPQPPQAHQVQAFSYRSTAFAAALPAAGPDDIPIDFSQRGPRWTEPARPSATNIATDVHLAGAKVDDNSCPANDKPMDLSKSNRSRIVDRGSSHVDSRSLATGLQVPTRSDISAEASLDLDYASHRKMPRLGGVLVSTEPVAGHSGLQSHQASVYSSDNILIDEGWSPGPQRLGSGFIQDDRVSTTSRESPRLVVDEEVTPSSEYTQGWQSKLDQHLGKRLDELTEQERTVIVQSSDKGQFHDVTLPPAALELLLKTADDHQIDRNSKTPPSDQKKNAAVKALNGTDINAWKSLPDKGSTFKKQVVSDFINKLAPTITNRNGREKPVAELRALPSLAELEGNWQNKLKEGKPVETLTDEERTVTVQNSDKRQSYNVTLPPNALALLLKTAYDHQINRNSKAPPSDQKKRAAVKALNGADINAWKGLQDKGSTFKTQVVSDFINKLAPTITNREGRKKPVTELRALPSLAELVGNWQNKLKEGKPVETLTDEERTVTVQSSDKHQSYNVTLRPDALALLLKTADDHQIDRNSKLPPSEQKKNAAVKALNGTDINAWNGLPDKKGVFKKKVVSDFINKLAPTITNRDGRQSTRSQGAPASVDARLNAVLDRIDISNIRAPSTLDWPPGRDTIPTGPSTGLLQAHCRATSDYAQLTRGAAYAATVPTGSGGYTRSTEAPSTSGYSGFGGASHSGPDFSAPPSTQVTQRSEVFRLAPRSQNPNAGSHRGETPTAMPGMTK